MKHVALWGDLSLGNVTSAYRHSENRQWATIAHVLWPNQLQLRQWESSLHGHARRLGSDGRSIHTHIHGHTDAWMQPYLSFSWRQALKEASYQLGHWVRKGKKKRADLTKFRDIFHAHHCLVSSYFRWDRSNDHLWKSLRLAVLWMLIKIFFNCLATCFEMSL